MVSFSTWLEKVTMSETEKRYRVTAEYRSVHQIIIEATSPEEAEYFANDIDLDKWKFIDGEYEIIDVSKDFFLKRVKD
jgi:hypothetical protein